MAAALRALSFGLKRTRFNIAPGGAIANRLLWSAVRIGVVATEAGSGMLAATPEARFGVVD